MFKSNYNRKLQLGELDWTKPAASKLINHIINIAIIHVSDAILEHNLFFHGIQPRERV